MMTTTLKTWTTEGKDDDGCVEITVIEVQSTKDGLFCVIQTRNGAEVDYAEHDTLDEAKWTAAQWACDIRVEYREREREQRRERREALMAAADDLDLEGDDAAVVKLLARLIGKGRAAEALVVLRALAK